MAFSVVPLSWVLVVVTYNPKEAKAKPHSTYFESSCGYKPLSELRLKPAPTVERGLPLSIPTVSERPAAAAQLQSALAEQHANPGDMLLLLGAADCHPYREAQRQNEALRTVELANRGAHAVA
jgi:hypothetical protein